jgi:hypothetical protein
MIDRAVEDVKSAGGSRLIVYGRPDDGLRHAVSWYVAQRYPEIEVAFSDATTALEALRGAVDRLVN